MVLAPRLLKSFRSEESTVIAKINLEKDCSMNSVVEEWFATGLQINSEASIADRKEEIHPSNRIIASDSQANRPQNNRREE